MSGRGKMKIRRVSDRGAFLKAKGDSPESLARKLKISNMTIRRLLKKADDTAIPDKYHAALDALSSSENRLAAPWPEFSVKIPTESSFGELLVELEKSGEDVKDLEKLQRDVTSKYDDKNIGTELRDKVALVLKSIFSKDLWLKQRAICIGALLYFLNPIDLIPDTIPVIGYLDDFAVLSLVGTLLLKRSPAEKGTKEEES
jgi:uncharacterized membrane protein YkvA (DUF1232 family)